MSTVAQAYAKISADMRDFSRELNSGLSSALRSAGSAVGTSLNTVGRRINQGIVAALVTGAAAGVAALGVVVSRGFGRLRAIDEAEAKLRGFGYSATQVGSITDDALNSVRGTAFGLGEAMTAAAGAVAAGVKPGEELERVLTTVANSAAAAGTDFNDMGAIFNQVASQQKAQNDVLNRVAKQGIPIYEALANQFNVTADAVFDMASRGEISFEDFEKAMATASGNVAEEMGTTLPGIIDNFFAAVGRLGETAFKPIYDGAKEWIGRLTGVVDNVEADLGPIAERIGARLAEHIGNGIEAVIRGFELAGEAISAFRDGFSGAEEDLSGFNGLMQSLGEKLSEVVDWFNDNREMIQRWGSALSVSIPTVAALASAVNLVTVAFRALTVATPVGIILGIATALVYAYQNSETFRNIVTSAFGVVVGAVEALGNAFGGIRQFFEENQAIADAFKGVLITLGATMAIITTRMVALKVAALATATAKKTAAAATTLFGKALNMTPIGRIITLVSALVAGLVYFFTQTETGRRIWETVWGAIKTAAEVVVKWFQSTVGPVLGAVWNGITTGLSALGSVFSSVFGAIRSVVETVVNFITGLFGSLGSASSSTGSWISSTWQQVQGIFQTVGQIFGVFAGWATSAFDAIVSAGQAVYNFISGILGPVFEWLGGVFSTVFGAIQSAAGAAFGWILEQFQAFADFIGTVLEPILDGFLEFWGTVWEGIQEVFSAVWEGIQDGITAALDYIQAMLDTFLALITGDWEGAWQGIQDMLEAAWEYIVNVLETAWEVITTLFDTALSLIGDLWDTWWNTMRVLIETIWNSIKETVTNAINAVKTTIDNVLSTISGIVTGTWNTIYNTISGFLNDISSTVSSMWTTIQDTINTALATIAGYVVEKWNEFLDTIKTALTDIWSAVRSGFDRVRLAFVTAWQNIMSTITGFVRDFLNAITGLGPDLLQAGINIMNQLWEGVKRIGGKIVGWVKDKVVGGLKGLWPFSPAKDGPFKGRGNPFYGGQNIMKRFTEGIQSTGLDAVRAALKATEGVADALDLGGLSQPSFAWDIPSLDPIRGGAAPLVSAQSSGNVRVDRLNVSVEINYSGDDDPNVVGKSVAEAIIEKLSYAKGVQ